MMGEKGFETMRRSLIVLLTAILFISAGATSAGAQGRGHHGGGMGGMSDGAGVRGGAGFNVPPVVTPGPFVVAGPPGPIGIGRSAAPFAVAPVRVPPRGFGRPIRTIVVPPVVGYYSPYTWPAPIYGGTAYSVYPP